MENDSKINQPEQKDNQNKPSRLVRVVDTAGLGLGIIVSLLILINVGLMLVTISEYGFLESFSIFYYYFHFILMILISISLIAHKISRKSINPTIVAIWTNRWLLGVFIIGILFIIFYQIHEHNRWKNYRGGGLVMINSDGTEEFMPFAPLDQDTKSKTERIIETSPNTTSAISNAPNATLLANKSIIQRGEAVTITVSAESSSALQSVWWLVERKDSPGVFKAIPGTIDGINRDLATAKDSGVCTGQISCTYSGVVTINEPGVYIFKMNARDATYGKGGIQALEAAIKNGTADKLSAEITVE